MTSAQTGSVRTPQTANRTQPQTATRPPALLEHHRIIRFVPFLTLLQLPKDPLGHDATHSDSATHVRRGTSAMPVLKLESTWQISVKLGSANYLKHDKSWYKSVSNPCLFHCGGASSFVNKRPYIPSRITSHLWTPHTIRNSFPCKILQTHDQRDWMPNLPQQPLTNYRQFAKLARLGKF